MPSYYSTTLYTSLEEIEKALRRSVRKGKKKKKKVKGGNKKKFGKGTRLTKYEAVRIEDNKVLVSSTIEQDVKEIIERVNLKAKKIVWKLNIIENDNPKQL